MKQIKASNTHSALNTPIIWKNLGKDIAKARPLPLKLFNSYLKSNFHICTSTSNGRIVNSNTRRHFIWLVPQNNR
jgi:hypothetical protein